METSENKILYHKNTLEFATVANEYCKFLEDIQNQKKDNFIGISIKLLTLLYLKTSLLPAIPDSYTDDTEQYVTETHYNYLVEKLAGLLGIHDTYVTIENAQSLGSPEPEDVYLSECFADIYQDMKNFTENYSTASEPVMMASLWTCRYNFEYFWGGRLLAILPALHLYLYNNNELAEESDNNDDNQKSDNPWLDNFFTS